MNDSILCKSYFKSGDYTTVQRYTNIWIRLINQLERSKETLSGVK